MQRRDGAGVFTQRIRLVLPQPCSQKVKNTRKRMHGNPHVISRGHQNACEHHLLLTAMLWTATSASQSSHHLWGCNNTLLCTIQETASSCCCRVSARSLTLLIPQHSPPKPSAPFSPLVAKVLGLTTAQAF